MTDEEKQEYDSHLKITLNNYLWRQEKMLQETVLPALGLQDNEGALELIKSLMGLAYSTGRKEYSDYKVSEAVQTIRDLKQ